MLDLALIRSEPARVRAALARRGVGPEAVDAIAELDGRWTERQEVREALRLRRRRIAEEVAQARAKGDETGDIEDLGRQVGDELAAVEAEIARLETQRAQALLALPNLPATDTPDAPPEPAAGAAGEHAATAPPRWAKPFAPLHHADLIELLGLAQAAGRGLVTWRGRGARLVRALIDFMLDVHIREFGCEEVRAPALATRAALTGSAHLPLMEEKMYAVRTEPAEPGGPPRRAVAAGSSMPTEEAPWACHPAREATSDLFLAPRAEPHLAGLYAGQVLDVAALPVRLVSAGPAFRREAGGGGAAGRGLARLHQFDTVELYTFAAPGTDEEELARMVRAAETILARLEVPHRRRLRAATDLSHAAAKTADLEVWAPGMQQWLTVGAISSFTDYQARRTLARCRDASGRLRLVHTLGGAAVALPHLVAALLETGQEPDGSVRLPQTLAARVGEEVLRTGP
jgi:seryl-tRNA synthetase